jgi:hypothetical protein
VAGASAPAPSDAAPVTGASSGDGGAGSHLSGRACPLTSSSSSSSSSDDVYSSVPDEESPCETARRCHEAPLVEADEADHVATRGVGRVVPSRQHDPLGRPSILIRSQLTGGYQLAQGQPRRRRALPRQRVDDGERLLGRHVSG